MKQIRLKVRFFNGYRMRGRPRRRGINVVAGTHRHVDPIAPKDTLLIERMKDPRDHKFLLAHECLEHLIMRLKKWSYPRAHAAANRLEYELRRGECPEAAIRRHCVRHFGKKRGAALAGPLAAAFRKI